MIVDGRALAARMLEMVAHEVTRMPDGEKPILAIVTCAPNFETKKYLALKERKAAAAGIILKIIELLPEVTTNEVVEVIQKAVLMAQGVVVQLPLPVHIDREVVLQFVPVSHDPDGFGYEHDGRSCLPPVVAAVAAIARAYEIEFKDKRIVIVGQGRLVGMPMKQYLSKLGFVPTVVTERTEHASDLLKEADIVITGVGKPGLITDDMVKEGVVIFDAGTSEEGGVLVGDVDPMVAHKAKLFTPVPGGIGPITVAALLANVMILAKQQ